MGPVINYNKGGVLQNGRGTKFERGGGAEQVLAMLKGRAKEF